MSSAEPAGFLYPFIDNEETDAASLLADLARSAAGKWRQSTDLRNATLAVLDGPIRAAGAAMAERVAAGGQVFTMGNGGSATDAEAFARLCTRPPRGIPVAARSLVVDQAVLTALSNDVSFEVVFSRQLMAFAREDDVVVGFSTSGNSDNLMMAFAEARKRRLLTVGLAGYDGGRMGASDDVAHCLTVRSDSVHRIQESQSAVAHALWEALQTELRQKGAAA
jgi:D-sedoheptulose 7-phosphate isomerase